MFLGASNAGYGLEDDSAVIKIFRHHPAGSGGASMKLGVIADDFTGATDIAGFLVENGLPPSSLPASRQRRI